MSRCLIGFGLSWVLIRVAESAAGMNSPRILLLGLGLAALVLVGQHALFAVYGVASLHGAGGWWAWPMQYVEKSFGNAGVLEGPRWFHPNVLLALNVAPLVFGGGVAVMLNRD